MPQTNPSDYLKIEWARQRAKELLRAHQQTTVLGDRLRAFVLFGPVAEGTGYDEIDILEVVEDWTGPYQGLETIECTGSADFLLPGHLYLTILSPQQLKQAARLAHPMLQEVAKHRGNGDAVLFDPDGLIAQATQSVQDRLAQLRQGEAAPERGRAEA
jgi:hypothetical protein